MGRLNRASSGGITISSGIFGGSIFGLDVLQPVTANNTAKNQPSFIHELIAVLSPSLIIRVPRYGAVPYREVRFCQAVSKIETFNGKLYRVGCN